MSSILDQNTVPRRGCHARAFFRFAFFSMAAFDSVCAASGHDMIFVTDSNARAGAGGSVGEENRG
jgi:hypothetical protein